MLKERLKYYKQAYFISYENSTYLAKFCCLVIDTFDLLLCIVRWLTKHMTIFFYSKLFGGKVSAKVQSIRMFLLCWVLRRKNALMWNDMYYRYFPKGTITSFQSVLSASNYASCIVGGIPKEGKLHKKSSSKKEIYQNITWKKGTSINLKYDFIYRFYLLTI